MNQARARLIVSSFKRLGYPLSTPSIVQSGTELGVTATINLNISILVPSCGFASSRKNKRIERDKCYVHRDYLF